jgi:hypothetical protein
MRRARRTDSRNARSAESVTRVFFLVFECGGPSLLRIIEVTEGLGGSISISTFRTGGDHICSSLKDIWPVRKRGLAFSGAIMMSEQTEDSGLESPLWLKLQICRKGSGYARVKSRPNVDADMFAEMQI